MPISPSTFSIETGQTQQISVSSFSGTKWGIREGVGSVSQTGLFTAGTIAGNAVVRVMYDIWQTIDSPLSYGPDNTLTQNTAGGYWYAYGYARLTTAGDQIDYFYTGSYSQGISDGTSLFSVHLGGLYLDFGLQYTPSPALVANDRVAFVRIGSNQVGVKVNDTLVYTYSQTLAANPRPVVIALSGTAQVGDVVKAPWITGAGVTNYQEVTASGAVLAQLKTPREGCEGYYDPGMMSQSNGTDVTSFTDQSGKGRHLTASSSKPTYQTNVINSKPVIRFSGSNNPLKHNSTFTIRCGWIVAKFDGTSFSAYQGLLSSTLAANILTSQNSGTNFVNLGVDFFEFRSGDRIYPQGAAPAPLNAFRVIFFRFWTPVTMDGLQLGQERNNTGRKFDGDAAFLAVYSCDFVEEEIRLSSETLANHFALTLASNVYPYQADWGDAGHDETFEQSINVYDPPEGDRIGETINSAKRVINCKFSAADKAEIATLKAFYSDYYETVLPIVYRDYRATPPVDFEGYLNGPYELKGVDPSYAYSFELREK